MTELLIYNKVHWMDELTEEQIATHKAKEANWDKKFAARYQKGDIIEVRPDGFWTGERAVGFNKKAFRVIAIPEMSEKDAHYLMDPSPTKKRRYCTFLEEGKEIHVASVFSSLSIVDKGS